MPPLAVTAWLLLLGAIPLVAFVPSTIATLTTAPREVVASVAYLAAIPTAIGYVTWAMALKRLPAGRAANFMYCVPPTATLIGFRLARRGSDMARRRSAAPWRSAASSSST